jgi:hypothetical protein
LSTLSPHFVLGTILEALDFLIPLQTGTKSAGGFVTID